MSERIFNEHGEPVCPHCKTATNRYYRGYPALNCWNCGGVMWRDESGRTSGERSACRNLNDTLGDRELLRLLSKGKLCSIQRCIDPTGYAHKKAEKQNI